MNSLPDGIQKTLSLSPLMYLYGGAMKTSNTGKWEANRLPLNGTSLGFNKKSREWWKLNSTYFCSRNSLILHQNLPYTRSALLLLQIYRNLKYSHNHSHNVNKTDYDYKDYISDHEIPSFIPGKNIWAKTPNCALKGIGYFFLHGRNTNSTFPLNWKGCFGITGLSSDTEIRKPLPSTAYIPNLVPSISLEGCVRTGKVMILDGCLHITLQ